MTPNVLPWSSLASIPKMLNQRLYVRLGVWEQTPHSKQLLVNKLTNP
jgi:hypothetical protein